MFETIFNRIAEVGRTYAPSRVIVSKLIELDAEVRGANLSEDERTVLMNKIFGIYIDVF